jgi:hypothetical protein
MYGGRVGGGCTDVRWVQVQIHFSLLVPACCMVPPVSGPSCRAVKKTCFAVMYVLWITLGVQTRSEARCCFIHRRRRG